MNSKRKKQNDPDGGEMAVDIPNGELQQNKQDQNKSDKKKRKLHGFMRHFEDMYIFSLMYMHKSPLQPLIGPGEAVIEDYSLAHACYLVIWLFLPIAYLILALPSVKGYVVQDVSLCDYVNDTSKCEDLVVTLFTNRFSLAIGSFYVIMASVLSISCERSEHIRSALQNGFWMPKLVLIFVVSLITSSFPPGIFDTIWHYILTISTISQSIFVLFLLLDLGSDISSALQQRIENEKKKCHKVHTLCYGSIAILLGCSLGMTIYCVVRCLVNRLLTWLDVCFLLAQGILLLVIFIASIIKFRSFLQLTLVTVYAVWRTGLALEYHISLLGHRSYRDIFTAADSVAKFLLIGYGIFRPWRPWYYTFFNKVVFARYISRTTLIGQSEKKNADDIQSNRQELVPNTEINEIECKDNVPNGMKKETCLWEKEFLSRDIQSDVERGEEYCELRKSTNNQVKEIGKRSIAASNKEQKKNAVFGYEHNLVHLVLFQSLLDLNANFAHFQMVSESESKFQLGGSLFTAAIHGLTSIVIILLYALSKIGCKSDEQTGMLSATSLIRSLKDLIFAILIEAPPFARKPQQVKYLYAGILTFFIAVACSTINPAVKTRLADYSLFCVFHSEQGTCLSTDPSLVALFRVSISATVCFLLLSFLLLRVETLKNFRNKLQTGFWPSKVLFCALIFAISLTIPIQIGNFWIYMSLGATLLVIMLQTIFVLDATSQILLCLREPENVKRSKQIFFSCSSITVFLYTVAITAFFCFYVYFAQFSSCRANRLFIFINLGLCITACLISLHPVVQEGGLVQSAIITSFCMYCTWSALYNNPREDCNPLASEMLETDLKPTKSALFTLDIAAFFATFAYVTINIKRIQLFLERFTFVCCQFSYFRSKQNHQIQQEVIYSSKLSFEKALLGKHLEKNPDAGKSPPGIKNKNDLGKKERANDTEEKIPYSYSLLHFIYVLLMLHFSLLLITWVDERPGSHMKVNVHWAMMCIRMMASCCSVLVYMWNLVVHLILHSLGQSK